MQTKSEIWRNLESLPQVSYPCFSLLHLSRIINSIFCNKDFEKLLVIVQLHSFLYLHHLKSPSSSSSSPTLSYILFLKYITFKLHHPLSFLIDEIYHTLLPHFHVQDDTISYKKIKMLPVNNWECTWVTLFLVVFIKVWDQIPRSNSGLIILVALFWKIFS